MRKNYAWAAVALLAPMGLLAVPLVLAPRSGKPANDGQKSNGILPA